VKYLLDTDTCIYWLKGREAVKQNVLAVGYSEIAISVITVAELYFGAYNSTKINENLAAAEKFIQSLPVLNLSQTSLKYFGQLKADLK
jgi:tRNA(fMet)-specific endonuclease VapC